MGGEDCGRCRMGEVDLAGEGERWGVLPGLRRCTCCTACAICCLFKIGKMVTLSPARRLAGLQDECSVPLPGDIGAMRVEPVLQFGGALELHSSLRRRSSGWRQTLGRG